MSDIGKSSLDQSELKNGEAHAEAVELAGDAPEPVAAQPNPAAQTLTPFAASGGTALGQAIWLMLRMPMYRHVFLCDLEWMVLPPVLLNQFQLFHAGGRAVAFAAWAYLSPEAEARLQTQNPRLSPVEWKSGDRLWLVNMFAPYGHGELAVELLAETTLKGQKLKFHRRHPDNSVVAELFIP